VPQSDLDTHMILAHEIRLDPTVKQRHYFARACGTARFAYNWALAEWNRQYQEGKKPKGSDLKQQFNAIREEQYPWTYDVHRDCTAQPFANLQTGFTRFFKKTSKHPKFKKKGQHDSFYVANDKLSLTCTHVRIPVLGWVRTQEPLRFKGKIQSATVKRVADAWFIVVTVDVGEATKERTGTEIVGVDLGIATTATLSTGEQVQGPKSLRRAQAQLRRKSRQHSRRQRGSRNSRKAKNKLARLHRRVAWQRKDFLHKLSSRLCRENQTVVIEDLNVKGMVQNHCLAKAISDEGWGELRRQLGYKATLYASTVVVADRWFPSSKRCSNCGHVVDHLDLSVRTFICPACGFVCDRDHNAALNLKQLGEAIPEVTPVERKALVLVSAKMKLSSLKQEFHRDHL
jgi:putative transposase